MGRSTSRPRHIPGLDGLRGVAVLAVLAYHFAPEQIVGGYLGVSVFFTLSGYLITRLILDEIEQTGSLSLRRFYDRRLRRLVPAASLVVVAVVVATAISSAPATIGQGDALAAVFWYYNWHELGQEFVYGGALPSALGHYWSLSIEEQFYIVYPSLVVLAFTIGRRTAVSALIVTLAVFGLVANLWIDNYFNSFARMWEITAGAVLALTGLAVHRRRLAQAMSTLALALVVVLCLTVALPRGNDLPNAAIIACTLATLAVIACAEHHGLLAWRPLRLLGTYSYSLYLWHWPVIVFFDGWVLQLALTAGLSLASYHLVEAPIRYAGGGKHETHAGTNADAPADGGGGDRRVRAGA